MKLVQSSCWYTFYLNFVTNGELKMAIHVCPSLYFSWISNFNHVHYSTSNDWNSPLTYCEDRWRPCERKSLKYHDGLFNPSDADTGIFRENWLNAADNAMHPCYTRPLATMWLTTLRRIYGPLSLTTLRMIYWSLSSTIKNDYLCHVPVGKLCTVQIW